MIMPGILFDCCMCYGCMQDRLNDRCSRLKAPAVTRVEMVQKTNLWQYQGGQSRQYLKIVCALPNLVAPARGGTLVSVIRLCLAHCHGMAQHSQALGIWYSVTNVCGSPWQRPRSCIAACHMQMLQWPQSVCSTLACLPLQEHWRMD